MDIAALSEENVNVANWVNSTLQKTNGQPNKEAVVSSLVTKLQLYVQQVNSALEDTSQQVLAGMPRIVKDAQTLHTEARQLKCKMAEVQKNIYQVHKETGACMANLERLDSMKTKLTIAKEGLQESDGWGKLIAELEDLFEQNELTKSCEKLKSLQRSLVAQIGLPGQAEREMQIEGYKNRLEALASPAVVQCFTNVDAEQSRKFVDIFDGMNRLPQLVQYYVTVQKQIMQQHWSETIDLSQNSNSTQFLREFYDYLLEFYQKQQKWCGSVFGSSGNEAPVTVLVEFLLNMQPSRESTIVNVLKRSDDKLVILQDFSNANIYLGKKILAKFDENASANVEALLKRLADAIYGYFGTFIGQTASFEQNWLATKLSESTTVYPTASESVRALGSANSKIFQWANETLNRCAIISHNCGLPAIVIVLSDFFKSVLEKYKKAQQQLHASQGSENDWNLLQTCISLLQHVGDFRLKLSEFEEKLSKIVIEKDKELREENINSLTYIFTSYKLAGKRQQNDFQKLVESAQVLSTYEKRGGIFAAIFDQIKPICEYVHDTTLASIFAPIEKQMTNIVPESEHGKGASGNDLPDYSFAPQEFITVIGQYLLTLPQHLEPLLLTPNQQLKAGLELCDERYGRNNSTNEACADILLSLLVDECCALYTDRIAQMWEISAVGAKQVACDIEYLGSVIEELGLGLSINLQQTITLLRAPIENYLEVSAGCDPRLVTAIRQIRKIVSKDS